MVVYLKALLLLLLFTVAFTAEEEDELVFTFLVTRHGARSPAEELPADAKITEDKFKIYIGDLTASGERQHYLEGVELQKIYEEQGTITKPFDPREFHVVSTNFNRTIMSAYSQLLGYFPLGSLPELSKARNNKADPPFTVKGLSSMKRKLGTKATAENFQPVPIHVSNIDEIMLMMDKGFCPYQTELRKQYTESNEWSELNDKYQKVLFPELHKNFGIKEENLDFTTSYPYIDNYYSAWFEQMEIPNELSKDAKDQVDDILRDGLYEGFFGMDLAVRLATTKFFDLVKETLGQKINAILEKEGTPEFYEQLKYMYISAHDSSLTAIMSGLLQKQEEQAYFASNIIFELRRKKSSNANDLSDFTVALKWNGKKLNWATETCTSHACPFPAVKEFLESRMYQGDLEAVCQNGLSSSSSIWLWILLAVAIFIALANIGYFAIRGLSRKDSGENSKGNYSSFTDEEQHVKNEINKSSSSTTPASRYIDEDFD
ncbi:unnamed protein product [Moneuplotes crassus]|uniref:Acid phosphatase n=1 Tax=Euplotes crassus TaxID=5936 RepID=A0AAD1X940_EUPCR|nr:unnamed protein product [Moneuplotes crassus]